MKVYVLSVHYWDYSPIRGVYSTLDFAMRAAQLEMLRRTDPGDIPVWPMTGKWEKSETEYQWWSAPRGTVRLNGWTYLYKNSGPTEGVWGIEEMEVDGP